MIAADAFVDELSIDLTYRLDLMRALDLARAISRRGLAEADIAYIIRRHDLLQAVEGDGGAPDVVEVVLQ
jgi:hypothetical protein